MTDNEAKEFVKEVLQGIWTKWVPTDMQYSLWVYILKNYDFDLSKKAIRDWSIGQEKLYKEPNIAIVKQILTAAKLKAQGANSKEPVLLYTIIKERFLDNDKHGLMGEKFYAGTPAMIPDEHEIERRAERDRRRINSITNENHVIKYANIVGKE